MERWWYSLFSANEVSMGQGSFVFESEVESFLDGMVEYYPNFFKDDEFSYLKEKLNWRKDLITIFGKTNPIPRLHCWYGDQGINYEYSNIHLPRNDWPSELIKIKDEIEEKVSTRFNGMLANYYRDGSDYVSWHSDDEKSLGPNPTIACASFGGPRVFSLKNRKSGELIKINLQGRSLLIMHPPTQREWLHQIPKSKVFEDERISLTFRFVHQ
ncbi:alpha-ketoglutarate-dependent dioxygenase AlkB family protein [Halobacteriovorax marinus]|uniref:alpha-ketoglutarate-dependent dioxygenase AlkB family protein n=1 Tax=Halobacteriovorax marinus TaxID=97084 RepID=UPI0012FDC933|nr:alpha-ketoglutarate-dependent dioxygenase AlkB [Halobacteriovorax marinus]